METTIVVTLVVKGDADRAAEEVTMRLNDWFCESESQPPYEPGDLLYWRQRPAHTRLEGSPLISRED